MTWFAKASTNILNLHLIVVVHSILVGLCPRIFLDSLYVEPLSIQMHFKPANNIEEVFPTSTDDEVDLDPRSKFEESQSTFDEPMLKVQLGFYPLNSQG